MEDFITSHQNITLTFSTDDGGEPDERKNIESKIIVSTNENKLRQVTVNSHVRIYFFVNLNGNESSCYEFNPFDDNIVFTAKKNRKTGVSTYSFEKTINEKYKQEISFKIVKNDDDDDDDDDDNDDNDDKTYGLDACLSKLFDVKKGK